MSDQEVSPAPDPEEIGTPELPPGPSEAVEQWVGKLVALIESQPRNDATWCPSWAEHPEAVWRFTALHQAFVLAHVEADLSSWWVNHFDRHALALFGPSGIFEACKSGHESDRQYRFAKRA